MLTAAAIAVTGLVWLAVVGFAVTSVRDSPSWPAWAAIGAVSFLALAVLLAVYGQWWMSALNAAIGVEYAGLWWREWHRPGRARHGGPR